MSSNDATMEAALLKIAKDLLQASDDLASTDPAASAKLAHEAYEIGRDLGIVRNHLDDDDAVDEHEDATESAIPDVEMLLSDLEAEQSVDEPAQSVVSRRSDADDESDDDLLRILNRQKAILPKPVEVVPVRSSGRGPRAKTFESAPRRRSGWFGWMRSREWRHAG